MLARSLLQLFSRRWPQPDGGIVGLNRFAEAPWIAFFSSVFAFGEVTNLSLPICSSQVNVLKFGPIFVHQQLVELNGVGILCGQYDFNGWQAYATPLEPAARSATNALKFR